LAAHPEALLGLFDCCLRSPLLRPYDLPEATCMLSSAVSGMLVTQPALLGNTAAVAAVVSAITSMVKQAGKATRAAASTQQVLEAATAVRDEVAAAAAYFASAAPVLLRGHLYGVSAPVVVAAVNAGSSNSSSGGDTNSSSSSRGTADSNTNGGGSSSSSSSQAAASTALLAVVLARGLVQLADAVEAVGPVLFFNSLKALPRYGFLWASNPGSYEWYLADVPFAVPQSLRGFSTLMVQWRDMQLRALTQVNALLCGLEGLGMAQMARQTAPGAAGVPSTAAAAAAAAGVSTAASGAPPPLSTPPPADPVEPGISSLAAATAEAGLEAAGSEAAAPAGSTTADDGPAWTHAATSNEGSGGGASSQVTLPAAVPIHDGSGGASSSSSSSNNSSGSRVQQKKWGYLLQLHQASPRWAAAVAAYDAGSWDLLQQALDTDTLWLNIGSTPGGWERVAQQYRATVELCRVLAAEAPLPLICNNPSCDNLAGVSEAAAACKKCAGCRCCYCSAACQTADWKRHKAACRRMAAAGLTCV
jgi:hypothetical protein